MSAAATQARLWDWQRISAMVLALCVAIHLVTIVYAVRGGLSAAEILARTQGKLAGWLPSTVRSCSPARCTCRSGWRESPRNGWAGAAG